MAGYDLAEGRYENRTLSDDEMWSAFSNLFSSHSKNSSSYKFGFLKAIMDNLYNVDENLTLTFDQLFGTFTEVYWNLVLKHGKIESSILTISFSDLTIWNIILNPRRRMPVRERFQ